ncbi:hypothetical protein PC116_g7530 [Phytophthora cactorum]|uniref:Uncharacterized protein n=1 Tax=Phytophthora cactorum TaxID=29920 RepID=A0A8T1LAP0_9STRA|nr:hypothetical protein Pcac1_g5553 [Phytophthora cactorum]KAG2921788.1 hypothetical protein PC114_g5535 [Phytophthora cactorum]KAG2952405.1 hypothetical protein PC117_g2871 [Phytophthora cactorum]KAG3030991.1 hypothetical protein PC120_g3403 [Phytophthora cactorum]KAG3189083.1 hypothetical protein C6341_g2416 [Phytophthora cactorum]
MVVFGRHYCGEIRQEGELMGVVCQVEIRTFVFELIEITEFPSTTFTFVR